MKDVIALLQSLTLPAGATTGQRIVLNGQQGNIQIFNAANQLVVLIDPVGYIEIFDGPTGNQLATMDDLGLTAFKAGNKTAGMDSTGIVIYDATGGPVGSWDGTGIGLKTLTSDTFYRLLLNNAGSAIELGSGAAAIDTNLYRAAANVLKTDDTFNAVIDSQVNGVSLPRGLVASGSDNAAGAGANSGSYADYSGSLQATFTAVANRTYKITLFVPRVNASTTGLAAGVAIREGTTVLEEAISNTSVTGALTLVVPTVIYTGTFSAGAHTVKASTRLFSGVGTVTPQPAVTGGAQKCRILVEDVSG